MEEIGLTKGHTTHANYKIKPEQFFILFPLFLSIALMVITYLKRRRERDVLVNCWFCNQNFKVPRGNENCFDCPVCEQYNGFKDDGDYNKPIPAQYNEDLNYPMTGGPPKNYLEQRWSNGLCSQCNHNQAVKVKLTAAFQPVIQSNEDEELKAYVAHLENLYRLCWRCQVQVRTTLEQQNAELAKLLPNLPITSTESVAEVPKTKRMVKIGHHLITLGEFLCMLCSICIMCANAHISWFQLCLSHVEPYVQVLPSLSYISTELSNFCGPICYIGLFTTVFTTILDKALKGIWSIIARLSLWVFLLLCHTTVFPSLIPYLTTAIFPGDKFIISFLLSVFCALTLWKTLTAKHKQHRIQKRNLSRKMKDEIEGKSQRCNSVADWIAACNDQEENAKSTTSESSTSRFSDPSFVPKRIQLSHSFDQLHISVSKQATFSPPKAGLQFTVVHNYQRFGKSFSDGGFSNQCRPLLRPAQFFPSQSPKSRQSISQSSWVAGGFWLSPDREKSKAETAFSASPGHGSLLTPPPSLDGSQTSRPGSVINDGFAFSTKSVFEDGGRSWPPSHASLRQRGSPHSSTPQPSELNDKPEPDTSKVKRYVPRMQYFKRAAVVLSVCCNLLVIVHFVWR